MSKHKSQPADLERRVRAALEGMTWQRQSTPPGFPAGSEVYHGSKPLVTAMVIGWRQEEQQGADGAVTLFDAGCVLHLTREQATEALEAARAAVAQQEQGEDK